MTKIDCSGRNNLNVNIDLQYGFLGNPLPGLNMARSVLFPP